MDLLCMACRNTVPDEFPLCIKCGAPLGGAGAGLPAVPARPSAPRASAAPTAAPRPAGPDPEKLRIDVQARVLWGENRAAIRADFLKAGYAARDVDRALDEAVRDREDHFRTTGIRDIVTGAACLGGFFVLMVLIFGLRIVGLRYLFLGKGILLLFLLPPAGLYFLVRGISRVIGGGRGEGSATDVEDD